MMHQPLEDANADKTVRLVSGAVCDFIQYITNRPDPIVVGKDYSDKKLNEEFAAWAKIRQLRLDMIDVKLWMQISRTGVLE